MMRMCNPALILALVIFAGPAFGQEKTTPTVDDFLGLRTVNAAEISPGGAHVAYLVYENDFEADKDMRQLWVVAADGGGEAVQLTHGDERVGEIEWSADGEWLAFLRDGKLHFIRIAGGEPVTPELEIEGIGGLAFDPDGSALYFTAELKDKSLIEAREERYGEYTVFREDGGYSHIWRVALTDDMEFDGEPAQLTDGRDFSVVGFSLSPDGDQIAFATWPSPHLVDLLEGRVYVMPAAGGEPVVLDDSPGFKSTPVWHTGGGRLAYTNGPAFPEYADIVIRNADGSNRRLFDMKEHDPNILRFGDHGVAFSAGVRTALHLYLLDPADGGIAQVSYDGAMTRGYTFSRDGTARAYLSASAATLSELMVADEDGSRQLTLFSDQLAGFDLPAKELITWNSYDGLEIEGVLTKPAGFEEGRRYPLFVRTHGGPTGTDRPWMVGAARSIYMPDMLSAEGGGALVLQTNYRGSASYGEAFQSSNLKNLGIGPARDIIAGVEMLVEQGLVDPTRVGCLGWSQGGHISAMLATYSDICAAAIMGAGISDWRTYYYNTDITQFTTEYFDATPLADDAVYARTSPVTYIDRAKTPVLIQHGQNDQRVPIANGYQFRQLLLDKGVEARMIVYSGMGHGPRTPRMRRAINEHALAWFRQHLFGADPADFVHPVEAKEDEGGDDDAD